MENEEQNERKDKRQQNLNAFIEQTQTVNSKDINVPLVVSEGGQ